MNFPICIWDSLSFPLEFSFLFGFVAFLPGILWMDENGQIIFHGIMAFLISFHPSENSGKLFFWHSMAKMCGGGWW